MYAKKVLRRLKGFLIEYWRRELTKRIALKLPGNRIDILGNGIESTDCAGEAL